MSALAYLLAWLALALLASAAASGMLLRSLVRRQRRDAQDHALVDALARYGLWLAAQERTPSYEVSRAGAEAALRDAQRLLPPGKCAEAGILRLRLAALTAGDEALQRSLREQHRQQARDPEAWLDSGGQAGWRALCESQQARLAAVVAMARSLRSPG